jgi:Glycosyl transferase 4-like domain
MNRVLIVSPYFPPSTLAGVHRARIIAKHLPACGWEPIVFCVDERHHEQRLDPDLAALVPLETRIIKVGAWPTRWSRAFGIGDVGMRGFGSLRRAVCTLLEQEEADILFITALPGLPLVMGPGIKRRYGIPFVADLQDPWLPKDYETARAFSKLWGAHRIAAVGEPYALNHADHVTAVSELTNALIRSRYPWLPIDRFSTIPIGGDAADFVFLRSRERPCPWIERTPSQVTISYVGNVWTQAYKTLEAVFAAVATLKSDHQRLYERLRFVFVGSSNQPSASCGEVVMPIARRAGIADIVSEEPSRVPYLDALNTMVRSDIILMIGSDEPHYTASKLYPALLANRPVLGVFHEESSVCSISKEVGGVKLVTFGQGRPVESSIPEIANAIKILADGHLVADRADLTKLEPFLGPAIARKYAGIFEEVLDKAA